MENMIESALLPLESCASREIEGRSKDVEIKKEIWGDQADDSQTNAAF